MQGWNKMTAIEKLKYGAKMKKSIHRMLFYVLVLALCSIFLMPFIVMLTTSFKTGSDAFTIPVKILPRQIVWDNYPAALSTIPYMKYMGNTVFITILSVIGQLLVTPMIAYSLSKINWRGAKVISGLLMAVMMIPYTVTMIPLYRVFSQLHMTNTYIPLILPAFFGKPFFIIITRQFFNGIPNSLMEAARIDGAGKFKQIFRVTLPQLKPMITLMILMSCGRIFSSDFGLFYQVPQNSGALYSVTQTIDTYVYRGLMQLGDVGMSSAAGLFQSVVGFLFVFGANAIVRATNKENALF